MTWNLVVDSCCDMLPPDLPENCRFERIPFVIDLDGEDYADGMAPVEDFITLMEKSRKTHSACPSPAAWEEAFLRADYTLAITISSRLSGSYDSAMTARAAVLEEDPGRKIAVIDTKSAGPMSSLLVEKALELIQSGADFDAVVQGLQAYLAERNTTFALQSVSNLVKNGRLSKALGHLVTLLNMRIIGVADQGTLALHKKVRGDNKMLSSLVQVMEENHFAGGKVAISHCLNESSAGRLASMIQEKWPGTRVTLAQTLYLCSYYAERSGLIVAY